jgi:hypothetical protein
VKALFGLGIAALVLGLLSLVVPIPNRERSGVKVGDVSIGITTQHDEKVSPIVSAVLIVGGLGMIVAAKQTAKA